VKKLIFLFLSIILFGCGSRKVTIEKNKEVLNSDSVSVVKIDSVSKINTNIKITENFEEIEIKPEVCGVEMIVGGITYKNAVLKYKKANKVYSDNSNKIVSKKASKQVSQNKKEIKINNNKVIDKKVNYFVYLWLLLIPIGMYIYREIKKKLFL
jgi:hypothetical protein